MDIKELARQLDLSPTTVSRVLNGHADQHRISKSTQAKVIKAARTSNVTVNPIGRSLRLGVSQTVGLIVPDISNPFFASLACHIERKARSEGYTVLLADSQESPEIEIESFEMMKGRSVDGLIIAPVNGQGTSDRLFPQWCKPLVTVDRTPPRFHNASVVVDNFEAARQGVFLLSDSGHRSIACIHGDPSSYSDGERLRGYKSALKELGVRQRKNWIAGGSNSIKGGEKGARDLFSSSDRPTGILAFGNLLALGALNALHDMNLSIPADVSIVSFDEQPWAASISPPLTTIAQPVEQMGEMAMSLLLAALKLKSKRHLSRRIVLPFSIVERESIRKI